MPRTAVLPLWLAAVLLVTGCTSNSASQKSSEIAPEATITVESSDTECTLSATEAVSGSVRFSVKNTGNDVTEFYLYGSDGERIVSEVENIGPGLTREFVTALAAGSYITACKPGMSGDGIRADFTVTDSGKDVPAAGKDQLVEQATDRYRDYVYGQAELLVDKTEEFAAAYRSGDLAAARALYPVARTPWESIETVAESFADLDVALDAREADLEPGQIWTGWHRIEKDLWPQRAKSYRPLGAKQRGVLAAKLVADTTELEKRVGELSFTVAQIANGATGLMEEVATSKLTGEEEYWSRTDLSDIQANVTGAHEAFESLEPIVSAGDADLVETLDARFAELQTLLDAQRRGDGFVPYDKVPAEQLKALADAVNALAEPLSRVGAVVLAG